MEGSTPGCLAPVPTWAPDLSSRPRAAASKTSLEAFLDDAGCSLSALCPRTHTPQVCETSVIELIGCAAKWQFCDLCARLPCAVAHVVAPSSFLVHSLPPHPLPPLPFPFHPGPLATVHPQCISPPMPFLSCTDSYPHWRAARSHTASCRARFLLGATPGLAPVPPLLGPSVSCFKKLVGEAT